MSINVLRTRPHAWQKFLEQWLVPGTGGGLKEYRRRAKEDLYELCAEWVRFVEYQYYREYISEDQLRAWTTPKHYPDKLRWLINVRKRQGEPTGRKPIAFNVWPDKEPQNQGSSENSS